jgi:general secretion pathway protein G
MRQRRSPGFTLIEILVVVAILGILAAIALVNYRNAIERARQRRSMGDMRSLSTAVEAYAGDFGRYPPASGFTLPVGLDLPAGNLEATGPYLRPTYIRSVPLKDGWNSWFGYGTTPEKTDYILRSTGREGMAESAPLYGPTTDTTTDIILVNGQFVQWPEGVQH